MTGQSYIINSEFTLQSYIEWVTKVWKEKKWVEATVNTDQTRSGLQNSSLHLYCTNLSLAFNAAGLDMTQVLSHHAEIPWDKKGFNVKERIWRPVQQAYCQVDSTTKASTKDYPAIYEIVNRHTASKLGVSIDWPHDEKKAQQYRSRAA